MSFIGEVTGTLQILAYLDSGRDMHCVIQLGVRILDCT
jgi:hypothetical protein